MLLDTIVWGVVHYCNVRFIQYRITVFITLPPTWQNNQWAAFYHCTWKHRGSPDIADQLQGLHLQEKPGDIPLARIQRLFAFRPLGSGHFPQPEKDSFQERLALIPSGMVAGIVGSAVVWCIFFLGKSWVKDLQALVSSHTDVWSL